MSALGIISGTSMDGIDVALVTTDGEGNVTRGPGRTTPYTEAARAAIVAAMPDAAKAPTATMRTDALKAAEAAVTEAHIAAAKAFIDDVGSVPEVIGWHGQTVAHAPERAMTMQLGAPEAMARALGVPVMADLRQADVAAGGEGAPLVPIYHRALVRAAQLDEPALVINLGGVANVTFIDGDTLIAFDTGPASALMDDLMRATTGEAFDVGGRRAAAGTVDDAALTALLSHPYFGESLPKSLDRDAFSADPVAHLALDDALATLAGFSAGALGKAAELLPEAPRTVIAAGGGTHNATLMAMIGAALGAPVMTASDVGFSSDFMEAEAFAYLAVRSLRGLPITYPMTTGVPAPLPGGRVVLPED